MNYFKRKNSIHTKGTRKLVNIGIAKELALLESRKFRNYRQELHAEARFSIAKTKLLKSSECAAKALSYLDYKGFSLK